MSPPLRSSAVITSAFVGVLAALATAGSAGAQEPPPPSEVEEPIIVELKPGARFVTKGRRVFCTTEDKFHEIMAHIARQEEDSLAAMLEDTSHGCYPLAAGVPVTVVRQFITYVELRPDSMRGTIWTVPEALMPIGVAAPQDSTSQSTSGRSEPAPR